jgi:hypothetical protein
MNGSGLLLKVACDTKNLKLLWRLDLLASSLCLNRFFCLTMPLFSIMHAKLSGFITESTQKPSVGYRKGGHICFEFICFSMCVLSIHGRLVIIKWLNNSYHIDCKHGS